MGWERWPSLCPICNLQFADKRHHCSLALGGCLSLHFQKPVSHYLKPVSHTPEGGRSLPTLSQKWPKSVNVKNYRHRVGGSLLGISGRPPPPGVGRKQWYYLEPDALNKNKLDLHFEAGNKKRENSQWPEAWPNSSLYKNITSTP